MAERKFGKWLRRIGLTLLALLIFCMIKAWHDTMADPIVRTAQVNLPGLPRATAPLRLLVMSDTHVAAPDMPPDRLARIVAQMNAQRPDLVLITGDLISDRRLSTRHYSLHDAIAPLGGLKPRIGTFAVLGNHDHWRNAEVARSELRRAGIIVLNNSAVAAGPLAIAGLDDEFSHHADVPATIVATRKIGLPPLVISHSPDPFPDLPADFHLMFAGHTHCGQVRLPVLGAPAYMSRYGDRFACGKIVENGRTLFVTAGLGTSVLPFRFGVQPDVWLITVRPQ